MKLDLSNDTETEREQLAQKVFAFVKNPNSNGEQVDYFCLMLNELLELYPSQKPDWSKSQGLITALIGEPNAYCYRETFTEILGEQVLDLSSHSTAEGECLDLAKTVNAKIADPATPEKMRDTLKTMVGEMVSGGLETYPPEIVETFLCAPENVAWIEGFQKELTGEDY